MPFLVKTKTTDSVAPSMFSLLRLTNTFTRDSRTVAETESSRGVWGYFTEELPSGVDSIPLAMYAFMSGYLNAVSFTTTTVWCGFMTGNSVILGLALSRISLGQRREQAFALVDAQATTALVSFVVGIGLARLGDFSFWAGRRSSSVAAPRQDEEKGKQPEPESEVPAITCTPPTEPQDWNESTSPTRVGTPTPPTKITRIVEPVPEVVKPPRAYGRARLWLVCGTLIQALFLIASAVAARHDRTAPSTLMGLPRSALATGWTSVSGFIALSLLSCSMGFQGVMAHRMGSGFGATVVLSSLWVELVGSPGGLRWKSYRGVRTYTVLLFILGGWIGAMIRDDKVLGISNSLFVGAALRVIIALSWVFVKASPRA